jgi:hypothetical protein
MNCACCPECRLRFSRAATVYFEACPECGGTPQAISSLEAVVGFRLIGLQTSTDALDSVAVAVSLPLPDLTRGLK